MAKRKKVSRKSNSTSKSLIEYNSLTFLLLLAFVLLVSLLMVSGMFY